MSEKACHECGASDEVMASASRGNETRYFCHSEERSCYNYRRGRYFEDEKPPANPYRGIRRVRKAQWVYECRTCEVTSPTAVDLSTASLYKLQHERGMSHVGKGFEKALQTVADGITALYSPIQGIIDAFGKLAEPAPNLPYDPSLRNDKRKWGGR